MAANNSTGDDKPRRPPATSPQARENQIASLAYDLSEKRMKGNTASAQEIVYWLKVGSTTEKLLKDKILLEQELLKARVENMSNTSRLESLTEDALRAFKTYAGGDDEDDY